MHIRQIIFGISLGLFFAVLTNSTAAQEKHNAVEASVIQDFAGNLAGGKQTGQAHLGLINLDFSLNSDAMNLWKNGTLRIHIQNTYGQQPTEKLVGDVQVFNNIENGNYTYLYQFWYKHRFGDLTLLLGKHDLNAAFFASEMAGAYINSSFGIMPVASLNVPVSIFPATTLGFVGSYDFSNQVSMLAGVYNGMPGEITHSNFGTNLNLKGDHGYMYIGEIHLQNLNNTLDGTYKIGAYHHSGDFKELTEPDHRQSGANGLYLLAEQMVCQEKPGKKEGLGSFVQLGYSPAASSINDFYGAFGLNYSGIIPGKPGDQAGLAVAHASVNNRLLETARGYYRHCETVLEFTYKYPVGNNLVLQPDIQYIIHPGMKTQLNNAWAGTFRIHWTY
jgi:porin